MSMRPTVIEAICDRCQISPFPPEANEAGADDRLRLRLGALGWQTDVRDQHELYDAKDFCPACWSSRHVWRK